MKELCRKQTINKMEWRHFVTHSTITKLHTALVFVERELQKNYLNITSFSYIIFQKIVQSSESLMNTAA